MLKRLYVNNFKSLVDVEFRPAGSNLLIGPNNAGKTNLCSAIRFLGLTASAPFDLALPYAVGETRNACNVYTPGNQLRIQAYCSLPFEGSQLVFGYELALTVEKEVPLKGTAVELLWENLIVTGQGFDRMALISNKSGLVDLLNEEGFLKEGPDLRCYDNAEVPRDSTMLFRLFDSETNRRANLFKRYLQSWGYYHFSPAALRSPVAVREARGLLSDGSNLSRVFFALHNENPRLERKIIEAVKILEPRLDLFTFVSPAPESVYLFMEDYEGHRFGLQSISDGTLRFMAMAYLVLAAAEAQEKNTAAPFTMIEEPENGIYVGHLKPLLEKIDPSGQAGQFLFTTHSPYFIDLFDSNLEGVHLMKPGRPSATLVKPDPAKIRPLLDEMSLGELHYREMLE